MHKVAKCEYTFLWTTEAACPVEEIKSRNNCNLIDPMTGTKLDFQSLIKTDHYTVYTNSSTFLVNICGVASGCIASENENKDASVCVEREDRTFETLALTKDYVIELNEDKSVTLIYEGEYSKEIGTSPKILIKLECDSKAFYSEINFLYQNELYYVFEMKTHLACFPDHIDCNFVDSTGNFYDLKSLVKWGNTNWEVNDISLGHKTVKYHINFCKPLNPTESYKCPDGPVGSCQTSNNNKTIYGNINLGVLPSKPLQMKHGNLILHYTGGDICPIADSAFHLRYSTKIMLSCSSIQSDPVFIDEKNCEYLFSMATPAACPIKAITGSKCTVKDPIYQFEFDLNSLNHVGNLHITNGAHDYILNVCGEISDAPEGCAGAGACQTKPNDSTFAINAGMANSNLRYSDGFVQLIYESGKGNCHGKYNRTTVITFICSPLNSIASPSFIYERDDCTYLFEWPTYLVCSPNKVEECSINNGTHYFDLSPLSLPNNNYYTPGDDWATMFVINVCRPIIPYPDVPKCPTNSAICLRDVISNEHGMTSIGQTSSPHFENGKLILHYKFGGFCNYSSQEETYNTVIEFECEDDALESEPDFVDREGCTYYFTWPTTYACPVKSEEIPKDNCIAINPITGFVYNFTSLRSDTYYEANNLDTKDKYFINVCGAVNHSSCEKDAASCQIERNGSIIWNNGKVNSAVHFLKEYMFLNYTDGDICDGVRRRNTIIEFRCGRDIGEPVFLFEYGNCSSYFVWHTSLACRENVHCTVTNGSEIYDLSPLKLHFNHHTAITKDSDIYILNICGPLNDPTAILCPPNSAACRINMNEQTVRSLGYSEHPPLIDFEGHVTVLYANGSPCKNGKNSTARIVFLCEPGNDQGEPSFISFDEVECHYLFEWRTNLVCPRSEIIKIPSVNNCTYVDENRGTYIDLTQLKASDESYTVKYGDSQFLLSICGQKSSVKGCEAAGVCHVGLAEPENFGSIDNAVYMYDDLTLKYSNGDDCPMAGNLKRSAKILFICDLNAGVGTPQVYKKYTCSVVFKWKTNVVCMSEQPECVVSYKNTHYDLRPFSSVSDNWTAFDKNGNIYWLNICREVKGNHTSNCKNSAVCMKNKDGEIVSLGILQSQEIIGDSNGIILRYSHGSNKVCQDSTKLAKTQIKLQCGKTLSNPFYVSGPDNDCLFEFIWKTSIGCKEISKEVIPEKNGIIVDTRLNVEMDLSPLLNKTFHTVAKYHEDAYVYIINIGKGVGKVVASEECEKAAVCQTKESNFFRDIGSLATRNFYLLGSELKLEFMSNGRRCGKNKDRKVSTIINFVCVTNAGVGRPTFLHESGNCDYIFEWETALICHQNFKKHNAVTTADKVYIEHVKETSVSHSTQIIVGIVLSSFMVLVIVFIVAKKERRNAVQNTLSTAFRNIRLPQFCRRRSDRESLLLSSSVVTAYHEDSDVEIIT